MTAASAAERTTMQKIILEQFGPVTRFDAAHIIDDSGRICAYVAEPEARDINTDGTTWWPGDGWDEQAFRAAVESEVATWEGKEPGEKLWVQYDPDRNNATSVMVDLIG